MKFPTARPPVQRESNEAATFRLIAAKGKGKGAGPKGRAALVAKGKGKGDQGKGDRLSLV